MSSILFIFLIGAAGYFLFILYFIIGLRRSKPAANGNNTTSVAVIIAARNEAENLPLLLEDLTAQDYPQDHLTVLVVDDRSTDRTWEIIQDFSEKFHFIRGLQILEKSDTLTPKKNALTLAIDNSDSEIIISTDGDTRVKPTWVSSMARSLGLTGGITAGFSQIALENPTVFNQYQTLDFLGIMTANAGNFGWGKAWSGSGQNIAYRRQFFDKIGGFEPVADLVSGDDVYLIQSISKFAPANFNMDPGSFVTTLPAKSLRQFISQHIRWSSNSKRLLKTDKLFLLFLFTAFITNIFLLTGLFIQEFRPLLPMVFSIKFLFEASITFYGGHLFSVSVKPSVFILWSIAQPFYIPFVGLAGLAGKFRWKP